LYLIKLVITDKEHGATKERIYAMKQHTLKADWTFIFKNRRGFVFDNGAFIQWGGMGFQIEAADAELKAAIMAAKPN
jgi:hypothetical protein